jgi:hypothetical protein
VACASNEYSRNRSTPTYDSHLVLSDDTSMVVAINALLAVTTMTCKRQLRLSVVDKGGRELNGNILSVWAFPFFLHILYLLPQVCTEIFVHQQFIHCGGANDEAGRGGRPQPRPYYGAAVTHSARRHEPFICISCPDREVLLAPSTRVASRATARTFAMSLPQGRTCHLQIH